MPCQSWLDLVRGAVLDLDGTVYDDSGLIPGAAEAIAAIRGARLGLRFATNTSRCPRGALIERLRSLGVDAGLDEVITVPRAAAAWLSEQGMSRVSVHVPAPRVGEFAAAQIDERNPEAVVVGDLGDEWSVDLLESRVSSCVGGARLLAVQKNRYWRRDGALCLDAGPFVAAIEYATDVTAVVTGKPSKQFFGAAASSLGMSPEALVVVGVDVRTDVDGARAAGAQGVLVKMGKFRDTDLDHPAAMRDLVLESVADLPSVLGV